MQPPPFTLESLQKKASEAKKDLLDPVFKKCDEAIDKAASEGKFVVSLEVSPDFIGDVERRYRDAGLMAVSVGDNLTVNFSVGAGMLSFGQNIMSMYGR